MGALRSRKLRKSGSRSVNQAAARVASSASGREPIGIGKLIRAKADASMGLRRLAVRGRLILAREAPRLPHERSGLLTPPGGEFKESVVSNVEVDASCVRFGEGGAPKAVFGGAGLGDLGLRAGPGCRNALHLADVLDDNSAVEGGRQIRGTALRKPHWEGDVSGVFSVVAPPSTLPAFCSIASALAFRLVSAVSLEVAAAWASRLSALASAALSA
jgi:hypothetical protein